MECYPLRSVTFHLLTLPLTLLLSLFTLPLSSPYPSSQPSFFISLHPFSPLSFHLLPLGLLFGQQSILAEKSFLYLVISNQILILIIFFRLIRHQTDFRLLQNQSETCIYNRNSVWFNKFQKKKITSLIRIYIYVC